MLSQERSDQLEVIGYSNSDFTRCDATRKSTFGYVFLFVGRAPFMQFHGRAVKQSIISASIMQAEIFACFETTIMGDGYKLYFRTIHCQQYYQVTEIYCHKFVIVFFSINNKYFKGAKYMKIKQFAVEEEIQKQSVNWAHQHQSLIADLLKKGLLH